MIRFVSVSPLITVMQMNLNIPNPFPSCIRKIGIVSPAGIPDRRKLEFSIQIINEWGIDVVCGDNCLIQEEESYFAATCEKRVEDFNKMLRDSSVDLIWCSRGGYGSASILPFIDWNIFSYRKIPVLGYSDITALHLSMLQRCCGIPITAPMAQDVSEWGKDEFTINFLKNNMLKAFHQSADYSDIPLTVIQQRNEHGRFLSGPVAAANLTILSSMCGTVFFPDLENHILIVEDVGELPRKIDRCLVQLQLCGILSSLKALIFADFTNCGEPEEISRVQKRCARFNPGLPIFCGMKFGHTAHSCSFINGDIASIRDTGFHFTCIG